jgi:hypothetical protein
VVLDRRKEIAQEQIDIGQHGGHEGEADEGETATPSPDEPGRHSEQQSDRDVPADVYHAFSRLSSGEYPH